MRSYALGVIVFTDFLLLFTKDLNPNTSSVMLLLALLMVVITSFAFSALLRNFKSLSMKRNYMISGVLGIIVGLITYFFMQEHIQVVMSWFENNGVLFLVGINLVCALVIFFSSRKKKREAEHTE